ncbi:gamma-butyrobetaine hydroxylase-like domain-containing protein [Parapedomonas caeni]
MTASPGPGAPSQQAPGQPAPWPEALDYDRAHRLLRIRFDTGEAFELPAELLRVESPSAEVQGHGAGAKQIVPGKALVDIVRMEPVGRYAVRLVFDDGHDSGLYSWTYLHQLGRTRETVWQSYLLALAERGLSRA